MFRSFRLKRAWADKALDVTRECLTISCRACHDEFCSRAILSVLPFKAPRFGLKKSQAPAMVSIFFLQKSSSWDGFYLQVSGKLRHGNHDIDNKSKALAQNLCPVSVDEKRLFQFCH